MKDSAHLKRAFLVAFALAIFLAGLSFIPRSAAGSLPARELAGPVKETPRASEQEGKIISQIEFDPPVNGFGFRNYGRDHEGDEDLTADDLIRMFGADNVCMTGSTGDDCVLYEPAEEWRHEAVKSMEGGHCEGMAVTSLRFWAGLPFKGKSAPRQWQPDARMVFNLEHTDGISNYIAYYHVLQSLEEVSSFKLQTLQQSPSVVLKMLADSMKDGKAAYTLSIAKRIDGQYTAGHTITPFAVEEMGEGHYRVHVYDNNYPGQTKYVIFDTNEDTWRYHTAADPTKTASDYVGDANTHTLSLKRLEDRERDAYMCPFCPDSDGSGSSSHHASPKPKNEYVDFSLDGEGKFLVTNPEGKRTGFDAKSNKFVDEIPGSLVVPYEGGLDKDIPPDIRLPRHAYNKPYTINLFGKSLQHEVDADLSIEGAGFLVGFQDVLLDPGETMTTTVSPDGRELSFTSNQDSETPRIFISLDFGHKKPSCLFEVGGQKGGVKLEAGKTFSVRLDMEKEHLFFKDNNGKKDKYDVRVVRVNPDGVRNFYENHGFATGKADNYEMDFSKWDGKGEMCFEDDEEGNGFDDQKCVEEPNEAKPAKKTSLNRRGGKNTFGALTSLMGL